MPSKKSGLVPSIAKASKASENFVKGESFEKDCSLILHKNAVPVLVSPKFLRKYQLGQIDIALFQNKQIILYEVKLSSEFLGAVQKQRLKNSLDFLCSLLDCEGRIALIKKLPKETSFLNLDI